MLPCRAKIFSLFLAPEALSETLTELPSVALRLKAGEMHAATKSTVPPSNGELLQISPVSLSGA
jgi:hypothetical protein